MRRNTLTIFIAGFLFLGLAGGASAPSLPKFEPDPFWPKHLPNNWILGQVSGVNVDSHDHIWVIHRPVPRMSTTTTSATKPPIAANPRRRF